MKNEKPNARKDMTPETAATRRPRKEGKMEGVSDLGGEWLSKLRAARKPVLKEKIQ